MFSKYLTTSLLLLSLTLTSFLPMFASRAEAQLFGGVVFDPTVNASVIAQTSLTFADIAARAAAQAVIQRMVDSTVEWANTGFEGNPAYATNPKQYFQDIADGVAGEFIAGSDLGFLCSPFQAQIRLALVTEYNRPNRFQCTLTDVVGNIEGFYGDFSQGGWDGWFSMTQNNSNNPYGAYLEAKVELDNRLATQIGIESQQLDWAQGFLSWSECLETNPPPIQVEAGTNVSGQVGGNGHVPGKAVGECTKRGPVQTPGIVIAEQLNHVLPANMDRFVSAQHLEDLVEAFVTGALNKYVFSTTDGLFH